MSGSLFDEDPQSQRKGGRSGPPSAGTPLADRIRPRTLDEVVGQDHMLAPGKPLREAIEERRGTGGAQQLEATPDLPTEDP